MFRPEQLHGHPSALAPYYSSFCVSERLLLTGHSHQAWPDCGFSGQGKAWLDAAEYVDEKWERAFAKADRVRAGFARLLGDDPRRIALAPSTHDLVIRFLSGLDLRSRPRIVTTDGEYHTIRRQLDRLAEEGIEIARVPAHPAAAVGERLAAAADARTAAVLVSAVFFQTGHLARGLAAACAAARREGAEFLVDAYHALDAVPFRLADEGLDPAYVVGGGYKYCQLGEGNCFLRMPADTAVRPAITGWFAEFGTIIAAKDEPAQSAGGSPARPADAVAYGEGPARFAGATYDPVSHYRAAEVFDFFEDLELSPELLRKVSRHQVGLLAGLFDAIDADPQVIDRDRSVSLDDVGGFLALKTPQAGAFAAELRLRGVYTDHRGDLLRLGPAPYLSDRQLAEAMGILAEVVTPRPKHRVTG